MSEYSAHDHQDEGVTRKGFLTGTALTGAGVVAALVGGKVTTRALADALHPRAASATADFSFVQITHTHIGAHSPAN
jgi:hypothetical protein